LLAIRRHAEIGIFTTQSRCPAKRARHFLGHLDLRCCRVITRCVWRSGER
jgi:hypothetical protein